MNLGGGAGDGGAIWGWVKTVTVFSRPLLVLWVKPKRENGHPREMAYRFFREIRILLCFANQPFLAGPFI